MDCYRDMDDAIKCEQTERLKAISEKCDAAIERGKASLIKVGGGRCGAA